MKFFSPYSPTPSLTHSWSQRPFRLGPYCFLVCEFFHCFCVFYVCLPQIDLLSPLIFPNSVQSAIFSLLRFGWWCPWANYRLNFNHRFIWFSCGRVSWVPLPFTGPTGFWVLLLFVVCVPKVKGFFVAVPVLSPIADPLTNIFKLSLYRISPQF